MSFLCQLSTNKDNDGDDDDDDGEGDDNDDDDDDDDDDDNDDFVTGEFPSQRPVTRSLNVFFDLCLN